MVEATKFCRDRINRSEPACLAHYGSMKGGLSGFTMCPFGFTTLAVPLSEGVSVITGLVASPRFDDPKERERAKVNPQIRVSRTSVQELAESLVAMDIEWQRLQEETRRKLPQALHELRKLNAIVKQSAEKLVAMGAGSEMAENIAGAAQLMSNIFEIVEVLTNIEDVSISVQQKLEFIQVFDLAYKAKKIYNVRAKLKPIHISVSGDGKIGISGSKKYFPLVLQVLLDNAIKYGVRDSLIEIVIAREDDECVLAVSNKADHVFDPALCFKRGERFSGPEQDGDGLGLYLAKEVVVAHGGTIECSCAQDIAKFVVRVPAWEARRHPA
jgi:K+-sensing histidine kinase KdpD